MRVYDLFPFYNELDLLELRFSELDPIVDVYGLVELPVTFTDKPKPLYFKDNHARFATAEREIRCYTPSAYPSGPHPTVDWFQRAQLGRLLDDAQPNDIVILSDVDEIPHRETVKAVIEAGYDHPVVLKQRLYYHRVDLYDPSPWLGTIIAPRKCLGETPNLQELRELRGVLPVIDNGGWHFSWLGDEKAIYDKLQAVDIERENAIYGSDGIQRPKEDAETLRRCYETGADLFGRPHRAKFQVEIVPGILQPHEVEAWLAKHPQYQRFAVPL